MRILKMMIMTNLFILKESEREMSANRTYINAIKIKYILKKKRGIECAKMIQTL
jgi:hypothetical protein